jgi:ubiquinone/menaquinone biosynthesis C-methylase UbiE
MAGGIHMKRVTGIGLRDVKNVYGGPEGELWELIMGEQVHIGGFGSSMDLADKAGLKPGMEGVDLCCCTGGGMRFLVRFRGAARMTGVDATKRVVLLGRKRCKAQGMGDRIRFRLAEVTKTGLPGGRADFVWGEDAWCYVEDKTALIVEAARLLKPSGTIAFTDWIEGTAAMTDAEAERYLRFMKFPNVITAAEYRRLLEKAGCEVVRAEDTGRFAPYADLYLDMLGKQMTVDALRIIGFDQQMFQSMAGEMTAMRDMARAGKIAQGLFVARKK